MTFHLSSSAFADGERIPRVYTCEGDDISPPLAWSGAPAGVRSYVILCDDPDAPDGTWKHWAVYNIGADASALPEDFPKEARVGGVGQAVTSFERTGYGGPCPPRGHGTHHYRFRLLALDIAHLEVPADAGFDDVVAATEGLILAETTLIGTYSRE